jgi:hypothetical protein
MELIFLPLSLLDRDQWALPSTPQRRLVSENVFLVFYSWDRSIPRASTTQFVSFSAISLHKNPVEESPDNCLICCCE